MRLRMFKIPQRSSLGSATVFVRRFVVLQRIFRVTSAIDRPMSYNFCSYKKGKVLVAYSAALNCKGEKLTMPIP